MKIGMKLPFTLNNKRRNTNLKFDFSKVPFWTPEKMLFWFLKKTPKKFFSLCFSFDSVLKTIDAQMKTHKKSYWPSKTPLWPFLAVNNGFFSAFSKILIKITFVLLLFLKLKQMKNNNILRNYHGFYFKTQKWPFLGVNQFFLPIFFLIFSF